jgi:hypothetical protein
MVQSIAPFRGSRIAKPASGSPNAALIAPTMRASKVLYRPTTELDHAVIPARKCRS